MLGVDRKQITIGGESAGGGHSAALAIAARDRKEIPIAFQLLIYPILDDRTGSSRPVPSYIGNLVWTPACNVFGWTSILGKPAGSADVPPGSVPARVENLTGLPPAFISVGSIAEVAVLGPSGLSLIRCCGSVFARCARRHDVPHGHLTFLHEISDHGFGSVLAQVRVHRCVTGRVGIVRHLDDVGSTGSGV
jgi:acetyl esterase/lipase